MLLRQGAASNVYGSDSRKGPDPTLTLNIDSFRLAQLQPRPYME